MKKQLLLLTSICASVLMLNAQTVADLESFQLTPNSQLNGSGDAVNGAFTSGNANFGNTYQTMYGGYWSDGWAYSNIKNDTTAGYTNMYASYANGGNQTSAKYVVGQSNSYVKIVGADAGDTVKGVYVTNATYAALTMLNGDAFTERFGGVSGNDADYFYLNIRAIKNGVQSTDSVAFYLADYRFSNNTQDYIVKNWTWVDLSSLGAADSLVFELVTSDMGQFGANTPMFFCLDDLVTKTDTADFENLTLSANKFWNKSNGTVVQNYNNGNVRLNSSYSVSSYGDYWSKGFAISNHTDVALDSAVSGYSKLYTAVTGIGADSSSNYAIVQNKSYVVLTGAAAKKQVAGVYVTNSNYAYLSMKWGDAFSRKFTDSDYFALKIKGMLNGVVTDSVSVFLANNGSILTTWQWVDLRSLGNVDSVQFTLSSSDVGQFGMNTPGFFALDNFTTRDFGTGIQQANATLPAQVYPNPATDFVRVSLPANFLNAQVTVFDVAGKNYGMQLIENNGAVNVQQLNAGVYFMRIVSNGINTTVRFVKY